MNTNEFLIRMSDSEIFSESITKNGIKISNGQVRFVYFPDKGRFNIISSNGILKDMFCSINLSGRMRLDVKDLKIDNSLIGKQARKNLKNLQVLIPNPIEIGDFNKNSVEISEIKDQIGIGKLLKIKLKFISPSTNGSINGRLCVKLYSSATDTNNSIILNVVVDRYMDFSSPPLLHSISPIVADESSKWLICKNFIPENYYPEPSNITFFRNGYQSWSVSELLKYGDKAKITPSSIGRINLQNQDMTIKSRYISEMFTAITETLTHKSVIIGYLTHTNQFGRILMEPIGQSSNFKFLFVHSQFDNIAINLLGCPIVSEELLVSLPPSFQGELYLQNWAKLTGLRMNSRVLQPISLDKANTQTNTQTETQNVTKIFKSPKVPKVLSGWCSWYYYYTKIDQQEMVKNIEFLKVHKEFPVDIIQLDDGYQTEVGDFTSINEKFPKGMKWLVDQIHSEKENNSVTYERKKTIAGIWIAPFFAQNRSQLLKKHPDWFLRDISGKLIKTTVNWGGTLYALDLSKDEVIAHIKLLISTIVDEWGFDFIKIDFVFCSEAIKAVYSNPSLTRVQVYRRGIEAIRKAMDGCKKDSILLGCGAPLGPSIGLVDVMRIGTDTAAKWTGAGCIGDLVHNKFNAEIPALKPALIATINRSFMHNYLWHNDPDCVVVRKENSKLSLDEVKLQLTVFGLSSGQVFFSDDLTKLSKERLGFMNLLIPPYKKGAIALDQLQNNPPRLYGMFVDGSNEAPIGNRILLAVINWSNKVRNDSIIIEDILVRLGVDDVYKVGRIGNLDAKRFIVYDFWADSSNSNGKIMGVYKKDEIVKLIDIPRHGCKYLSIIPIGNEGSGKSNKQDELNEPLFISSNVHITQGCKEVSEFSYDQSNGNGNLNIKFNIQGIRTGNITILIPQNLEIISDLPEDSEIIEIDIGIDIGRCVKLPISIPKIKETQLKFKKR